MSDAIGPGMTVLCVSDAEGSAVHVGRTYTVADVYFPEAWEGFRCDCHGTDATEFCITLEGVPNPPLARGCFTSRGWCPLNFRPAGRRDDSLTRRLLEPLPDAVAQPDLVPA